MNDLSDKLENMLDLFYQIKQEVKKRDRHLYEQWKAGGFLVDEDIMSMYPNCRQAVESLSEMSE